MDSKEQAAFDKLTRENEQLKERVAELEVQLARLSPKGGGGPGEKLSPRGGGGPGEK